MLPILSLLHLPVSSYLLKLQDVFNLLPNLNVNELIKAFAGNTICHKCRHSNLGRYMGVICTYSFSFYFFFKSLFSLCAVKTNDMMLVIYLSSLIRSVIALHNLINNKVTCPLLTQIILSLSLSLSLSSLSTPVSIGLMSVDCVLQMLNKEHEKAEDAKPATVPPASGNWFWGFMTHPLQSSTFWGSENKRSAAFEASESWEFCVLRSAIWYSRVPKLTPMLICYMMLVNCTV